MVLSMDPLLVTVGFLVPSLVSWCGVLRFLCSDSSSGSFDTKCGQKVRSDAGGCAKRFCGEHVAEQRRSWSMSEPVIKVTIFSSFGSNSPVAFNFRTTCGLLAILTKIDVMLKM